MNLIVLAAGYATRLYPLTRDFPKPLLPVGGKPLLDHLLNDLGKSGKFTGCAVVTNDLFADHFRNWSIGRQQACQEIGCKPEIIIVNDGTNSNENRLGAVRDILWTLRQTGMSGETMVIAGDNLLDFSLIRFIEYYERLRTNVIMRYYEPDSARLQKCGVLELGENDLVLSMEEKPDQPKSHWCVPPFYIYRDLNQSKVQKALENGCNADAPGSLAAWFCCSEPTYAFEMPGRRYDIGTVEQYESVKKHVIF